MLDGEFREDNTLIEDYVDKWHATSQVCQLHEYLGVTWAEYVEYLLHPLDHTKFIADTIRRKYGK